MAAVGLRHVELTYVPTESRPPQPAQTLISQNRNTCAVCDRRQTQYIESRPFYAEAMSNINLLSARFSTYDKMYSHEVREQSFADWPFREDCNCTPEKVRGPPSLDAAGYDKRLPAIFTIDSFFYVQ